MDKGIGFLLFPLKLTTQFITMLLCVDNLGFFFSFFLFFRSGQSRPQCLNAAMKLATNVHSLTAEVSIHSTLFRTVSSRQYAVVKY